MHCPNCGFDSSDFQAVLALAVARLQQEGRLTYRSLQRLLGIDDAFVEDLREELIFAKHVARDEEGKVLVWTGGTPQGEAAKGERSEKEKTAEITSSQVSVANPQPPAPKPPPQRSVASSQ